MKWTLLGLLFLTAYSQAATLENRSSAFLKGEIAAALEVLPSNYLDTVNKRIVIEEAQLKSDALFVSEDLCKINEGVKFGITKKDKITISSRLVQLAQTNTQEFNCGHKTFRQMLKAVLIHELTHVKDNVEKISLTPDFQRIVGMKKVQKNSKKHLMNQNFASSPDAYEFVNLEESLAVNTEYLVLDPEFECRKPATAGFLAKRMGIKLQGTCQKNYKVLAQSAFVEDNYQLSVNIDPKRIYQVHYLFAGKGQALMSRWGHAMFRLIVCAPFRKTVGPECMDDVSHHLALSYRAYMSDINISYSKGMFGQYPSQLFIMRYLEVQQEYTKFDLRDLYSIPLKMSADQKKEFLDLTLERFWTYQGRYYFLDNNCGTETVKHLAVALSDDESKLIGSITPLKIYNDIVKTGNDLTDGNVSGLSREQMVKGKLVVESMFEELNANYQVLRKHLDSFKEKDFKKFLKKTNAESRLRDYEKLSDASVNMDATERKQIVIKLVYLERYLANRFLMEVPKKAIQQMNKDENLKKEVMNMGESLKSLSIQPWEVVNAKYGVPTAPEFEIQYPKFVSKRQGEIKMSIDAQMANLQNILGKTYFAKELNELEELKKIKKLTSELVNQVSNIN
jgi:Domain of unknown function (DUF4105)